jgi:lipopolysaccharide/colanic/teichoic acid biosynthesis glycosyltransferase
VNIALRPARRSLAPARQPHALYDAAKRAIDIAGALALLTPALPVMALAALAIWLTTREPPLLLQRRVGMLGRSFTMLKLRTMRGPDVEQSYAGPWPATVIAPKLPRNRRVTRIGSLLRRSSIDELPQLFNVLAGSMSLVGPRPALAAEVARYPASWERRLTVKPGLTGLWQVSGRSCVAEKRWMAMDRYYASRRSLLFDASILARSVAAVISMRGAW